jgi:hypothetical protein
MQSNISRTLNNLKAPDVYSLMLFALYKLKDVKEYSTLSELAYSLDKESLFNFLSVFGGLTIKIPTVKELQEVVYGLLVYQQANIEGKNPEDSIKSIAKNMGVTYQSVKDVYVKLCDVLSNYDFSSALKDIDTDV